MKDLRNEYEIMGVPRNDQEVTAKHTCYIHGLSLEGAEWDAGRKLLVETTSGSRFLPFPAIRIRTLTHNEATGPAPTPSDQFANFSLNKPEKRKSKKSGQATEAKASPKKTTR